MRLFHADADAVDEREDDERGHGVGDEGCYDEDQAGEDDEDAVQREAFDVFCNRASDRVQESRGVDGSPQREAAGRKDNDGPEEVVEVFLGENAGAEE